MLNRLKSFHDMLSGRVCGVHSPEVGNRIEPGNVAFRGGLIAEPIMLWMPPRAKGSPRAEGANMLLRMPFVPSLNSGGRKDGSDFFLKRH